MVSEQLRQFHFSLTFEGDYGTDTKEHYNTAAHVIRSPNFAFKADKHRRSGCKCEASFSKFSQTCLLVIQQNSPGCCLRCLSILATHEAQLMPVTWTWILFLLGLSSSFPLPTVAAAPFNRLLDGDMNCRKKKKKRNSTST